MDALDEFTVLGFALEIKVTVAIKRNKPAVVDIRQHTDMCVYIVPIFSSLL